jgi:aminoacrylate hydrolase
MPLADVHDGQLYYEIHGSGPPLVFSTGMGGVAAYWKPQITEFAKHFRVVVYDQRGTGRSTMSTGKYSVQLLADDLIGLMDTLRIDRAVAVGHSTGGMLMQCAVVDHPERFSKIVLYSTRASADYFTQLAMGSRLALLRTAGLAAYHRATPIFLYPSHWIKEHQKELDEVARDAIAASAPVEIMASRIEAVLEHDQMARVHRIKSPTLVMCAIDDYLTPPYYSQALAELVPGASLEFVSWGGHACSHTNPVEFNQKLMAFLRA